MSTPMRLIAENLACERGGRLVFKNLNFTLDEGELLELRGSNGAGKSSLLRLLAGLNVPAAGRVELQNGPAGVSLAERCHYIGHADAHKPALTVAQNLTFWAQFLEGELTAATLNAFTLSALKDDQALLLSAGQRRRLALTRLLLVTRKLWLLDEPTVGLDAASLMKLGSVIKSHLDEGGMVIAATHAELGLKASRQLLLGNNA
jgi:heme exporter protein A